MIDAHPIDFLDAGFYVPVDRIEQLFTELQPLEDLDDYQDYIARLSQVERQVDQLFEGLKIREEMGIIPPLFIIRQTRQDLQNRLGTYTPDAETVNLVFLNVYSVFHDKVAAEKILNEDEKADLLQAAREQIKASFIPGHIKLLAYLDEIEPLATDEAGVWKLPDGEAYYAWKLRWETSTDLTPEQVHELGLAEVERIQQERRDALEELLYPAELLSVNERIEMARNEAGYIQNNSSSGREQVIAEYELGHHFQIAISYDLDLPTFRDDILLNGYVEGWALNAEKLAWELGQLAQDELGEDFDLVEFHRLVLGSGSLPLEMLERLVREYIASKK